MQLRKFGSNQASFPGLNLISLYRVTDESEKKLVAQCIEKPESIAALQLHALCKENAWETHQNSRIKNCFSATPKGNGRSARNCRQSKRKPAEYSGGRMCAVCQCAGTARIIDKSGICKAGKEAGRWAGLADAFSSWVMPVSRAKMTSGTSPYSLTQTHMIPMACMQRAGSLLHI